MKEQSTPAATPERVTFWRIIHKAGRLAYQDPAALTALDAFLGTMLEAAEHPYWRGILMALLETGANTTGPRAADVLDWEDKRATAADAAE
jgi:hypothetical protein